MMNAAALLVCTLCALSHVAVNGQQDLKKATVLPSAEQFSSGGSSSEELGELAKLTANEPASASDGGGSSGGGMGGGMSGMSDMSSMNEAQFIRNDPQAQKVLKDIRMLSKLIQKAKLIKEAIPQREKALEQKKVQLKRIVQNKIKQKQQAMMQKLGSSESDLESKIKMVKRKYDQLLGAKAKLVNMKSQFNGKGGKKGGSAVDSMISDATGGSSSDGGGDSSGGDDMSF
mmetsp:Transcript_24685/g.43880  ORF Transcript_24685/g.43880 Transcript_24685/m.43880 type:complete len:230 (-) Transcript_24685:171-860(-)